MREDLSREEVVEVVDRVIADLLRSAGVEGPPVDAIALAQRHLKMIVCLDRRQEQRGRAQRAAGRKQIFLRPEPTEERHQWTVAHEIGEHLKAGVMERLGADPERTRAMAGESLANLFAHRLLTPTEWFAADARELKYNIPKLKQRYLTASHEVIAKRLLDLPEACIITIVDNDHIHFRRGAGIRAPKELAPPEKECQEYVNHYSRPRLVQSGGWTVQGWPVHQPDWKREILRSVVEENT
jgi:Zn-dependent peptidase ImmA (M78 family)